MNIKIDFRIISRSTVVEKKVFIYMPQATNRDISYFTINTNM